MKKMRGLIDPYTLGFLISLIGALTTYAVHQEEGEATTQTEKNIEQTESADIDLYDDSDV